jgi:YbbR-like protein
VIARSLISNGVNVQQPEPIAVTVDARQGVDLQVSVVAQAAPGWSIEPSKTYAACPGAQKTNPCTVHFDGPASWEKGMAAYVAYPSPVNVGSIDSPGYLIQLKNANGPLNLTTVPTAPPAGLDISTAAVHIEAVAGSTSSTVPLLDSPPSHPPPSGYRVTAITISPLLVTISGDPVAIGRIHSITLPPVDLSSRTSDASFQVTIPYPDGITGSIATAKVTYSISPNPNASP